MQNIDLYVTEEDKHKEKLSKSRIPLGLGYTHFDNKTLNSLQLLVAYSMHTHTHNSKQFTYQCLSSIAPAPHHICIKLHEHYSLNYEISFSSPSRPSNCKHTALKPTMDNIITDAKLSVHNGKAYYIHLYIFTKIEIAYKQKEKMIWKRGKGPLIFFKDMNHL